WKTEALLKKLQAADLRLDEARLNASGGNLAANPLTGKLSLRKLRQGDAKLNNLDLSLDGSLQAHRFSLQADSPLAPPAWLERLAGSNHRSGAKARVQGSGQWLRQAQGQVWTGTLAELDLRNGDGSGEPWLSASALGAALRWNTEGTLSAAELSPGSLRTPVTSLSWTLARFDSATSTRQASSQLDAEFASTAMAPLLARLQPEAAWTGDLRMGGHIKLRHAGQLDADLVLERLGGDLNLDEDGLQSTMRATPLGLTDLRLGLRAINGQWQFTQGMAGTYLGSLASAITVTADPKRYWPRPGATLQGTAQLNVANLGAWAAWIPAGWRLGGQIESGMQFSGTWGAPEVSGRLSGQRLSVRNALQGVALTEGELQLALDGSHAHLEKFRFKGGDGSLSVVGDAQLGARPQAKLNIEARRFRALGRIDRQLTVSGDAVMQLDPETLSLTGKLGADEGLIDISRGNGPSLSDDVVVIAPTKASPEEEQAQGSSRRVATLALDVDLGQKLRLRGHGIDTGLRGSLKLSNPRGKLSAQGSVRTEGGNFAAYGQKLSIERGVILFTGPVNDPRLDIYAIRPNLDVKVGVTITGTALNPRVRLASDTDMTDTDKLSWLVMGRAPEGLGQADTAMLQRAALALLMGEGGNPTDGLMESIGLSDFSLRQAADSNNVQTTVVTVGKQLTRRWYVGYERSVNATAGTWQLIYRIAQRFTLRAQSGEDSALDAIWTWRWD
ncbi:translocation/assembly module TamB domain-containing protein, partial [Ideonella sp.]|uniref:translocation/assembly module TamB domain-containing protein n=1 Tax=Ideonella sp. TaxID=1929293 RepID=UPI003BB728EE